MSDDQPPPDLPTDLAVPEGRERLGLAHQLRVDLSVVVALTPAWLKRALSDRCAAKARGARVELVERLALALERRFRISWQGSDDISENARDAGVSAPLFGGPELQRPAASDCVINPIESVDDQLASGEHRVNK